MVRWGPHGEVGSVTLDERFTPTRVGTTLRRATSAVISAVHPHACGDHGVWGCRIPRSPGSPPRVWGPQNSIGAVGMEARFTPTRVGTTI